VHPNQYHSGDVMQSERFPKNVIRYTVIAFLVGYFNRELGISFYQMSTRASELTSFQSHIVTVIGVCIPLLLVYVSGILADTYGRRLIWAVSLFLYGGGMVVLGASVPVTSTPVAPFTSFASILASAILYSFPPALTILSLAWLFDHEGRNGLKNAHGLLHILSALAILVGMSITMESFLNFRTKLILTGVIALAAGCLAVTFPENYGSRSSWKETNKTVVNQFISRRVLHLVVLYSIFMGFPVAVSDSALIHFINATVMSDISTASSLQEFFTASYIIFMVVSFCAGILLLFMKKIDYRKLIVYPMILVVIFYFLLPIVPEVQLYFILDGARLFGSFLIGIGIIILVNDSITENRATALAVLTLLMTIPTMLTIFWNVVLSAVAWEMACVIAGALAVISLVYLNQAARISEKDTLYTDND
jgi:MFS family permease